MVAIDARGPKKGQTGVRRRSWRRIINGVRKLLLELASLAMRWTKCA